MALPSCIIERNFAVRFSTDISSKSWQLLHKIEWNSLGTVQIDICYQSIMWKLLPSLPFVRAKIKILHKDIRRQVSVSSIQNTDWNFVLILVLTNTSIFQNVRSLKHILLIFAHNLIAVTLNFPKTKCKCICRNEGMRVLYWILKPNIIFHSQIPSFELERIIFWNSRFQLFHNFLQFQATITQNFMWSPSQLLHQNKKVISFF